MLHVGLDLSRKRVDVHVMNDAGESVDTWAVLPDRGGPRAFVRRLEKHGEPVYAAIESMNGARFVYDELELAGWRVDGAAAVWCSSRSQT
jgi:transposase